MLAGLIDLIGDEVCSCTSSQATKVEAPPGFSRTDITRLRSLVWPTRSYMLPVHTRGAELILPDTRLLQQQGCGLMNAVAGEAVHSALKVIIHNETARLGEHKLGCFLVDSCP